MNDWKQLVEKEKAELDDRLGRLSYFIDGDIFESLPTKAQGLLRSQESVMIQYSEILEQRLAL